jgi:glycosyltransferase involved in cell wall biosynthesis
MPRGTHAYLYEYFANPKVDKPIDQIYSDLDQFTHEYYEDEPEHYREIQFFVVLPPLRYEGRFVKGIFCSQAVDFLLKCYPKLPKLFYSMAFSMCISYPWSKLADGYLVPYDNPQRDEWFRKANPERADKIIVPLADHDFIDEYHNGPAYVAKDIDVICVSRLDICKNLPVIAEALKVYRQKYGKPIRMTLAVGKNFDANLNGLLDYEKAEMRKIEEVLIHPHDYIDFVQYMDPRSLLELYSRSRLCVLGSLIEGGNRSLREAMCANTPVVCFKEFNQYARGSDWIFPEGAGLYADFGAEPLADAIHQILAEKVDLKPRMHYLRHRGRKHFLNKCIDSVPYFATAIPGYGPGQSQSNEWLDLAVQAQYQLSLIDFLYDKNRLISYPYGLEQVHQIIGFYLARFAAEL